MGFKLHATFEGIVWLSDRGRSSAHSMTKEASAFTSITVQGLLIFFDDKVLGQFFPEIMATISEAEIREKTSLFSKD